MKDHSLFAPYEAFIANYAGSLALLLENRCQQEELEKALDRLEFSERRYRQLFMEMAAGHAVHEIILDDAGNPCDYRFLEINPAFENLTGLRAEDVIGKKAGDILPRLEPSWVERYGEVALTGSPCEFEDYNQDLDRHYSVVAYRPEPGQFAVVFNDVSERTRLQEQLRAATEELSVLNEELLAQNEELAAQREELGIQNDELHVARDVAQRLVEQQRDLLERVQRTLLDIPSDLPGVRCGHIYRSATREAQIGGDFYDVFRAKNGLIGLLIGDVSGHGIEAARVASLAKDTVEAFAHQFRRPHLVLRESNRLLVRRSLPGFVTLFLGLLDPSDGSLTYASAGHPPPLIGAGCQVQFLAPAGSPLGVFAGARYTDHQLKLEAGSLLLLYTDGITEARDGDAFFGEEGLARTARRLSGRPVEELPPLLLDEALRFSDGSLDDDIALLAIRYLGLLDGGPILT